jgi:hypothetical protein
MPAIFYAVLVFLAPLLTSLFFQLLLAVGVGVATYAGISTALTSLHSFFTSQYGGLPANVVAILGLARVDQAANLLLSAVTMRFTLAGLTSGTMRRFVMRAPA